MGALSQAAGAAILEQFFAELHQNISICKHLGDIEVYSLFKYDDHDVIRLLTDKSGSQFCLLACLQRYDIV